MGIRNNKKDSIIYPNFNKTTKHQPCKAISLAFNDTILSQFFEDAKDKHEMTIAEVENQHKM